MAEGLVVEVLVGSFSSLDFTYFSHNLKLQMTLRLNGDSLKMVIS